MIEHSAKYLPADQAVTRKEAAAICGCSVDAIDYRIERGHLRAYVYPGSNRIHLDRRELRLTLHDEQATDTQATSAA